MKSKANSNEKETTLMQERINDPMRALEGSLPGHATHEISVPPPIVEFVADDMSRGSSCYDDIAALAYQLWHSRGCPIGSPEEDWARAEGWLWAKRELKGLGAILQQY